MSISVKFDNPTSLHHHLHKNIEALNAAHADLHAQPGVPPDSDDLQHLKWNIKSMMEKPTKIERMFAWYMLCLVIIESAFLFLQAAQGFTTKSANDVNMGAFILLAVSNLSWTLYGSLVLKDFPLTLSGITYFVGAVLVIVTVVLYG